MEVILNFANGEELTIERTEGKMDEKRMKKYAGELKKMLGEKEEKSNE